MTVTTTQSNSNDTAGVPPLAVFGTAMICNQNCVFDASDNPVNAVPVFVAHAVVAENVATAANVARSTSAVVFNSHGPTWLVAPLVYSEHFQSKSTLTAVIVAPTGTPRSS